MNSKTEKNIVLYYLNNLLNQTLDQEVEDDLCRWFEKYAQWLTGKNITNAIRVRGRGDTWDMQQNQEVTQVLRSCPNIRQILDGKTGKLPRSPEADAVIQAFRLPPQYHAWIRLTVHSKCIPALSALGDCSHGNNERRTIGAGLLNIPLHIYMKFFTTTSELMHKGLVQYTKENWVIGTNVYQNILYAQCKTPDAVKRVVLGKPKKATLKPERFEHINEEYHWLKNLFTNALAKKQSGVNVLLYGKPGTGKTELAKTLCNEIGVSLFAISDNLSDEQNGKGRRSNLAAALCLLQGDHHSVLLMDEAEDVFGAAHSFTHFGSHPSSGNDSKSKLFFHKLLETNAVPVIWVCNNIGGVDPAHLRRFAYALEMQVPDESVQTQIWQYSARKRNVKLPKERIETLVRNYDIEPAIIDTSLRTAALTKDVNAIEKTIDSLQRAMGHTGKREHPSEHRFSTALLNCDTDLAGLTTRIASLNGMSFSLCLYGVPGSEKSAYARYLAEQLKMKVLHKRGSDLISKYVGESEHNIAAAFAEAKSKKMLLVFDEADSFLRDRRYAQRSWEVTQVNEMLTQMESHPLPFVCTTNLMEDLDHASLRRFTFKVKYDYLTLEQVASAFQHFFGSLPKVSLRDLSCLSPGDFAVVAKKALITGTKDHGVLVEMLRQEQEVKDVRCNPIGFAVG